MTERTITEEELKTAIASVQVVNCTIFHAVIDAAFPPIFKPKEGEALWTSVLGNSYGLKVFSHMDNGEYVCFEDNHEDDRFCYNYAKPQTPKQKGE
jgi:hypothetical protein